MQLSIADWAETMSMSRQAAYSAVRRCNIPVENGKVDADVATMLYQKRTRARTNARRDAPSKGRPETKAAAPGTTDDTYWHSRSRREQAEAELAELKLEQERGKLVDATAVKASFGKQVAAVREGFLQLPARLAPVLAAETDPAKIQMLLESEMRAVLTQFSGG